VGGRRYCSGLMHLPSTAAGIALQRLTSPASGGPASDSAGTPVLSWRYAKLALEHSAKRSGRLISDLVRDVGDRKRMIAKKLFRKLQPPPFDVGQGSLPRAANGDRDIPTCAAKEGTVHGFSGDLWMNPSAVPIDGSRKAPSHPAEPCGWPFSQARIASTNRTSINLLVIVSEPMPGPFVSLRKKCNVALSHSFPWRSLFGTRIHWGNTAKEDLASGP
jgi:hypothetical protein